MTTPVWDLFVALSLALVLGVVFLARQTAGLLTADRSPLDQLSTSTLYLNVGVSHVLVLGLAGLLVWWTGVPASTIGIETVPPMGWLAGLTAVFVFFNEVADPLARFSGNPENPLRELLTPENWIEWLVLAGVLLPVIAVTEELLFRGILIGAFGAGTPFPPLVLIVGSAVAFGQAHTAQGRLGVGVATVLGLGFGVVYYWSGSLWLVIGAHYLVDLVEFTRHARD
ncbi:MAG: CPBP family intramembrane glutamic endopeptidase [Halodesulfurarchaeum sp.]|nr:CPBP family intramembrane glutamic endopeptidase [Halodesulfurarchaeum sp.]